MLNVDRKSQVPAYKQITDSVVRLVDGGTLAPGDRLPPSRVLARTVGVHRSTVMRAYEELWALGYLESRPGSYSTVRRRARGVAVREDASQSLIDWQAMATPSARGAHQDTLRLARERLGTLVPGVVNFARLAADRDLAPSDDLRRCLKAILIERGQEVLDYGDPSGFRPLRETIARRMRTHGVAVSADHVMITGGAQQAIDLVLRAFTRPGDSIAIETPSYSVALPLFRVHGLELQEIPMRPEGMDLDRLEAELGRKRPALVYTIPNFHNPTGITTGQAHRERLLALCEAHRVALLEDGFEEEMKYFGKAILPIKSMDRQGTVIYVGTFSKVVFPGLRIGWIAAPRGCIELVHAIQRVCHLAGNSLAQAAVQRFCDAGFYEAHLRRVHQAYRKRMQAMLRGLREHMPHRSVEWTEPTGGYTLWMQIHRTDLEEAVLHDRLLAEGVKVSPGSLFFPRPPTEPHFRLSIACLSESEILEGCRRLGRCLTSILEA